MAQHITQLNKYISEHLKITRRAADRLIDEGQVQINGRPAKGGDKVFFGDEIYVKGKLLPLHKPEHTILLAYNKPLTIDGSASPKASEELNQLLNYKTPVYAVGRLGTEAQGLTLLTNDELLTYSFNKHLVPKTYRVVVTKKITPQFLEKLANGMEVLGRTTEKCEVKPMGDTTFVITLKDEINKQIFHMCKILENPSKSIERTQIANIELGNVLSGDFKELSAEQIDAFKLAVAQSEARKSVTVKSPRPIKNKPVAVAKAKPKALPQERIEFEKPERPKQTAKPAKPKVNRKADSSNWFVGGPPKRKRKY